jgi:hypothetical protein
MVALAGLTPRPRRVTRSRSGRSKCTTAAPSASRRRARMVPTSEARSRMGARRTKVGCDAKRAKLWPSPDDAPSWEDSARRPNSASALRVGVGLAGPGWSYNASAPFGSCSRRRRWTAATARGVAATASRSGWRARVRRVRRDSEGDPYCRARSSGRRRSVDERASSWCEAYGVDRAVATLGCVYRARLRSAAGRGSRLPTTTGPA